MVPVSAAVGVSFFETIDQTIVRPSMITIAIEVLLSIYLLLIILVFRLS
jgi:hypothetical protein